MAVHEISFGKVLADFVLDALNVEHVASKSLEIAARVRRLAAGVHLVDAKVARAN
jgi:hypothetical protein